MVLKYRVPRRDPDRPHWEPLQDVQRAIRVVRKHHTEWGIDSERVGVLGFSAGGHLTVMAGTKFDEETYPRVDDADDLSARPSFMCPIYAAYLGEDYQDDRPQIGKLVKITKETPPTFTASPWMTSTGASKPPCCWQNSRRSACLPKHISMLRVVTVTESEHRDKPVSTWHMRLRDWMGSNGLLEKRTPSE